MSDKELIIDIVKEKGYCHAVELATNFAAKSVCVDSNEFHDTVDELVDSGDLVELQYIRSDSPYRLLSIYFAKNTELRVIANA